MKSKKSKKIWMILGLIIMFIIGIFVGRYSNVQNFTGHLETEEKTTSTVTKEVGTQTIENTLTSAGEIASSDTEKLDLSTSKYFETMCVEEGDIVQTGGNILKYTNGTYLTADYTCLIGTYSVPESGEICTSSNYIEVQNIETMTMNLDISESNINKVAVGQTVNIEITALEDTEYTGTIKSINGLGTYSTSGTTFTAVVEFANDGNVKMGMSASCSIILEKAENCIAVPIEAVQTSGNEKYVVVENEDGTTQNVTIETGISNDSYVQVTSGLVGGEKIQMIETTTKARGGMNFQPNEGNMDFQQGGGNRDFMRQEGEMPGGGGDF